MFVIREPIYLRYFKLPGSEQMLGHCAPNCRRLILHHKLRTRDLARMRPARKPTK